MTEEQTMTIEEFNQNYRISVMSSALQDAELTKEDDTLEYGSVEEVLDNINYVVYNKSGDEIFQYDGESDHGFIQTLQEHFNIVEYEE